MMFHYHDHGGNRASSVVSLLILCLFSGFTTRPVESFAVVSTEHAKTTTHQGTRGIITLSAVPTSEEPHVDKLLFVECGFGADAHGQNATKASVRACRNAIEFNQLPALGDLIPGGRDGMKLDVLLAVPSKYQDELELEAVRNVFPYGNVRFQIQDGGMVAKHGKIIEAMGDKNEDMVVVCCAVSVGY